MTSEHGGGPPSSEARPAPRAGERDEAARGVAELESYLLRQTETHNAQHDAACFAAELPWLTSAQRKQVIRLYVRDRKALARQTQKLIETALEQRAAEVATAYEALRRRMCLTVSVLIIALTFALCLLSLTLLT
ncbi:hypothetical protein JW613_08540 [Streptomyces smyrnaeus]|uniref:Cytochrome C oxidase subunit I n=1 Tax=Streptomyces smyrnaeus TaxID=1387713 RepID=A0ABS3XSR6_9ACTN|nr:hypothetical protein [Streptomyces smyrnaeus]MBO8198353.1 hypothetical protein [Streptomyces smyrnaeus]